MRFVCLYMLLCVFLIRLCVFVIRKSVFRSPALLYSRTTGVDEGGNLTPGHRSYHGTEAKNPKSKIKRKSKAKIKEPKN